MVLAAPLGVGAVVAGVIIVTNLHTSSSSSNSSAATGTVATRSTATRLPVVVPSTVTVSVLNGTDTSELARTVSDKLSTTGYKKGYVGNYGNSQTKTSSTVEYMRGEKRDAMAVAAALKLRPTSVQPIDTTTQQIACPPANGQCASAVIVTVGSDLAGLATATPTQ
jgi:LytR cell envelope-related transcriptional attenuator